MVHMLILRFPPPTPAAMNPFRALTSQREAKRISIQHMIMSILLCLQVWGFLATTDLFCVFVKEFGKIKFGITEQLSFSNSALHFSIILFSTLFAVIASKYVIENIFQLKWQFDLILFINLSTSIGLITLILIILTNLKYLSPKVYPLVRNE